MERITDVTYLSPWCYRWRFHLSQVCSVFQESNIWVCTELVMLWASLVAQTVKNLPAVWEIGVRSLGREDLEKGMATHSSIPAWRIPWTEEPSGGYSVWTEEPCGGHKELDTTKRLTVSLHFSLFWNWGSWSHQRVHALVRPPPIRSSKKLFWGGRDYLTVVQCTRGNVWLQFPNLSSPHHFPAHPELNSRCTAEWKSHFLPPGQARNFKPHLRCSSGKPLAGAGATAFSARTRCGLFWARTSLHSTRQGTLLRSCLHFCIQGKLSPFAGGRDCGRELAKPSDRGERCDVRKSVPCLSASAERNSHSPWIPNSRVN